MNYTIRIELTAAKNFSYTNGYLRVQRGDGIRFTCNVAFKIKFLHGSPFEKTEFSRESDGGVPRDEDEFISVEGDAKRQTYHYLVVAIGPDDGLPYVDGGCPTIEVL